MLEMEIDGEEEYIDAKESYHDSYDSKNNINQADEYDEIKSNYDELKLKYDELLEKNRNLESEKTDLGNMLHREISDKHKQIDELNNKYSETIKEKDKDLKNLLQENQKYRDELEEFGKLNNSLEKQSNEKIQHLNGEIQQLRTKEEQKSERIQRLNGEIKALETQKKELIQSRKTLEIQKNEEIKQLKKFLGDYAEKNEYLIEKNRSLDNENSKWQNYVGKATTFSLNDSDENHSVQFVKDIENLKELLENYVGKLRPKVDVDLEEVNKLLRYYKCQAQVKSKENDIRLIKGVLQRHVLEMIIVHARNILDKGVVRCYENDIYNLTTRLLYLLEGFSANYDGTNDIIKAYPIKIRQQIYGLLGSIGFEDIRNGSTKQEHLFIKVIKDNLNPTINKIRRISSPQKKTLHDEMATNLIREVVRIYFFRSMVQEPIVEDHWFLYDIKIDPNIMEGRWGAEENEDTDEQIDFDNSFVEICSFPLLVSNYRANNQKIYSRAKVIQFKKSNSISNQTSGGFMGGFVNTVSSFVKGNERNSSSKANKPSSINTTTPSNNHNRNNSKTSGSQTNTTTPTKSSSTNSNNRNKSRTTKPFSTNAITSSKSSFIYKRKKIRLACLLHHPLPVYGISNYQTIAKPLNKKIINAIDV